ncbi:S8 family serine peptidase [Kribbella sp. NPDC005582]|uniref:S8 family serine peptidase n=1 Tax=Kribbella sp. NPDC005582 TaxID=3156893 RepID=UPI00339DDA24
MRKGRSRPAVAALAVLVAGSSMLGGTAAAGEVRHDKPSAQKPAGDPVSGEITMITGDRVILRGDQPAKVVPGKGRKNIKFIQRKELNGDLTVLPLDAETAVRSGELDARLFNVTQLIKNGYGDKSRPDIPLIVSGPVALRSGADHARSLPSVAGTAVRVAKETPYWTGARTALRAKGKQWIRLDGPVRAFLDKSVPQIGAPEAWKSGLTGKGTEVAVLDTGIDTTHDDLKDAVVAAKDFTESPSGTADKFGHGTHVASIVTGEDDVYRGVAPDAKLLNGKVLDDDGGGYESGIIAGMEWAANSGAEVINMSLGSDWPSDGTDVLSQAVNRLTADTGALFVLAAGNSGGTPGSPASADSALTVGAVDHNENLAEFSSRGPRWLDDAIKPDITAPGVDIVAAKAKDSLLGGLFPNIGPDHLQLSGTSMAAPHTAGAAAILAQQHPEWKAGELRAALMGTAKANPKLTVFEQGAGRVDVAAVVKSTVRASVGSISNGVVRWPHNDDKPINREVTYFNSGKASVTLDLAAAVTGPDGEAAPAGMFTVSPASLTIPAGGQATATVTTNTAVPGADGIYSGVISAGPLRTPIAVTREVESYDVTLHYVGFDGKPTTQYFFRFVDLEHPNAVVPEEGDGSTVVARVAKGRHYFESYISTEDGSQLTNIAEPTYTVDGPSEVTFDARSGQPLGFQVDKADAAPAQAVFGAARDTVWGGDESTGFAIVSGNFDGMFMAPSRTSSAPDEFRFFTAETLAAPTSSTYLYQLERNDLGKVPGKLVHRVRDTSLARVRSEHHGSKPGTYGVRDWTITRPLPFTLDEFYTPGTDWSSSFVETTDPEDDRGFANQFSTPRRFERGRTVTERWGAPAFGPGLPSYRDSADAAGRVGDRISLNIPLYSDGVPGHYGYAITEGTTVLSKDGKEVAKFGYPGYLEDAPIPAGPATYQLHTEATRDNPLSPRITADWTFHSDTVPGTERTPLPLVAVRFSPPVAGKLPITVDHNAGARARLTALSVSHDGGATWKPAKYYTVAGKTFALLKHPAGAKTVSLKATATDAQGNKVVQTVIDAFLLK